MIFNLSEIFVFPTEATVVHINRKSMSLQSDYKPKEKSGRLLKNSPISINEDR